MCTVRQHARLCNTRLHFNSKLSDYFEHVRFFYALCANVHQDDVTAAEVLPMHPLELRENRNCDSGDSMQAASGRLEVQILDDQLLPEVREEAGTFATLRLPHQDHRRHLGVELGGAKRRGARHRRVAFAADPEVNGTHRRVILQILHLRPLAFATVRSNFKF